MHLIGHDWGSVQAWSAVTAPALDGRIASFTSISGPSLEQFGHWLRDVRRHPVGSVRQVLDSYYTLLFQLPGLPEAFVHTGLFDRATRVISRPKHSSAAQSHRPERTDADKVNGLQLYRANLGRAAAHAPERVRIPVQVVAPKDDPFITVAAQTGAPRAWVDSLRTRVVSGGHWIVAERPDVVARLVDEFVTAVAAGDDTGDDPRAGDFGGQLVVVTGGARGIGRATALEFARHGADVVIADVNDTAAKQTVRDVEALGVTATAYHLDVSDAAAWDEFAATVRSRHGVPDVVVNNAGIGMAGPFLGTDVADWERILGVNVWGVIHGSRLFGRQMVERGEGGRIVNVSSAAAFSPSRTLPAYATTKSAVLMLTECLRAELAPDGIAVTAICPGFVDSDIPASTSYVGVDAETAEKLRAKAVASYQRRNYTPEQVAKHLVRAARRRTPVAAITPEAKVLRALGRFAPPLARRVARVDLNRV